MGGFGTQALTRLYSFEKGDYVWRESTELSL